jgi:hypothetical protein
MAVSGGVIGALRVVLGADTAQFERGLSKAEVRAEKFGRAIGTALRVTAIAAAAAGTALALAVRGAITEADKLGKMAQSIGVPVEELSKLKHAADLSGVSLEGLAKGVGRLARNTVEAAQGLSTPIRAFAALGIEIRNTDGALKTVSEILPELAGRFSKMRDGPEKTALAMQLLGRAGADMIPLLNAGEDGLRAMMEEAEQLGLVIDNNTAKAAERFNDNLTRLRRVFDGVVIKITAELLPSLDRLLQKLLDFVKNKNNMVFVFDSVKAAIHRLALEVGSTIVFFQRFAAEAQAFILLLGELAKAPFFGPGLAEAFRRFREEGEKTQEAFSNLGKTIDGFFGGGGSVKNAFNSWLNQTAQQEEVVIQTTDKVTKAERDRARWLIENYSKMSLAQERFAQQVEAVGSTIQSSFTSAFDSLVDGTFSARKAIAGLLKDLARLALNNAFSSLIGGVTGRFTGQLVSPNIPMFATGGSFNVGGSGGIDSQLVQFMATPGERVVVDKNGGGGMGSGVNINMNVDARGSDMGEGKFRQIMAESETRIRQSIVPIVRDAQSRKAL